MPVSMDTTVTMYHPGTGGQGVRVNVNRAPWEVRDGVDTRKQVLTQQVLTRPDGC